MPQIGPLEILVVGILALLVFGPEKLPDIARSVGRAVNQLKTMASEAKSEFDVGLEKQNEKPAAPSEKEPAAKPTAGSSEPKTPIENEKPGVEQPALVTKS